MEGSGSLATGRLPWAPQAQPYIHLHVYIYTQAHTNTHTFKHMYTDIHVHSRVYTHTQRHIHTSASGRKGTARGMKVKQSTAGELGSCQVGELARCPWQPAVLEPSVLKATTELTPHTLVPPIAHVTPAQGPRGIDRQSLLIPIIQYLR